MASHMTVSLELVAFLKWILQHKQTNLNSFIAHLVDDALQEEFSALTQEEADISTQELCDVINTFLGHIENQMAYHVDADDTALIMTKDSSQLYNSLPSRMQRQLMGAFDNEVLVEGVEQAAYMFAQHKDRFESHQQEQGKHDLVMSSLLESWMPVDDEVN